MTFSDFKGSSAMSGSLLLYELDELKSTCEAAIRESGAYITI